MIVVLITACRFYFGTGALNRIPHFTYVFEQFLEHANDPVSDYISDLVPWSETIPDRYRKLNM